MLRIPSPQYRFPVKMLLFERTISCIGLPVPGRILPNQQQASHQLFLSVCRPSFAILDFHDLGFTLVLYFLENLCQHVSSLIFTLSEFIQVVQLHTDVYLQVIDSSKSIIANHDLSLKIHVAKFIVQQTRFTLLFLETLLFNSFIIYQVYSFVTHLIRGVENPFLYINQDKILFNHTSFVGYQFKN